jgi:CheY-like chemotaxis protein
MLDVRLDNADGREICAQIKTNPLYKHVKVILMSAMLEGWKDVPCQSDAKVDKPFDIDEVRDLVLSLLSSKTRIQESV